MEHRDERVPRMSGPPTGLWTATEVNDGCIARMKAAHSRRRHHEN